MSMTSAPQSVLNNAAGVFDDLALRRSELDEAVCLEIAGPASWRVCDSRVPRGQGRFLGFVERKADQYEVMQIQDDFVWTTHPTMRAAVAHIVESRHPVQAGPVSSLREMFQ